jgi:hypothetical protein
MSSFLLPESAFLIRTEIVRSAGSFIAAASNGTVLPPESTFFYLQQQLSSFPMPWLWQSMLESTAQIPLSVFATDTIHNPRCTL